MSDFAQTMREAGIDPAGAEPLVTDGTIHRFCGPGDKVNHQNCWYVQFENGAGAFGDWRQGIHDTVSPNGNGKISAADRKRINEAKAEVERQRNATYAAAASKAQRLLNMTFPLDDAAPHPYLLRKGVRTHGARRLGETLVVTIRLVETGHLTSLEFISPDGTKRFLAGGRIAGGYYPIAVRDDDEDSPKIIVIAEGFATGASVFEACHLATAVAFFAGNLVAVAKALRQKYAKATIVIAADDDHKTPGNPGLSAARAAALAVGGFVAVPKFAYPSSGGSDFNDLALAEGSEVVAAQVNGAIANGIPFNFELTKHRLFLLKTTKNRHGQEVTEKIAICSPIHVDALTRDVNGCEWGRLLRLVDPDGREHTWAMPMEAMAGDGNEYRARLLAEGLVLCPGRDARYGLDEYLGACRPLARARAVTRIGWHAGVFVLPGEVFGDSPRERTIYQSAVSVAHAFNVSGSLEEWKGEVAAKCVGNSRLILAVSAAFAAPLLNLTGDESGGFHLVGASSLGKTTALRDGGSVWGGASTQTGYNRAWRATSNGLEGIAAIHCDCLLCLDELSEVAAREAGAVAYMLANGSGKSRARRDGSARAAFSWRLLFLSSGEITLADKIREDGRQRPTAGQSVRVLDLPADAGAGLGLFEDLHGAASGQRFADELRDATQKFYGTAARAFLAEIVSSRVSDIADAVRQSAREFVKENIPQSADGQVQRAVSRFALVAAAGELASALGVTGWPQGAATWAAKVCFAAWLDRRGHVGPAEIEAGVEQVRRFFALHAESRFSAPNFGLNLPNGDRVSEKGRVVVNRAGFQRGNLYYVYPEIFRSELAAGFDPQTLAAALVERGALLPGKEEQNGKRRMTQSVRDLEGKKTRVYVFTDQVVGDPEGSAEESNEEDVAHGK